MRIEHNVLLMRYIDTLPTELYTEAAQVGIEHNVLLMRYIDTLPTD